jgi:hypothetical protein
MADLGIQPQEKSKKRRPYRRSSKRFWHDARIILFTAILTTVSTYLLNRLQFAQEHQRQVKLDKDRIYQDYTKAVGYYRGAAIERALGVLTDNLRALAEEANSAVLTVDTNAASPRILATKPPVGRIIEIIHRPESSDEEMMRRLRLALADLNSCIYAAKTHFGTNVCAKIDDWFKFNGWPESKVEVASYYPEFLAATLSGDLKNPDQLIMKIQKAYFQSLTADPQFDVLKSITTAMQTEINSSK